MKVFYGDWIYLRCVSSVYISRTRIRTICNNEGERHDDTDQRVSSAFGRSWHSVVTSLPAAEAMALHTGSDVLFVDVRDVRELQKRRPDSISFPRSTRLAGVLG